MPSWSSFTCSLAWSNWRVADPLWLLALLALPSAVWLRGRKPVSVLMIPFASAWHRPSLIAASRWPAALALAGLGLVIAALARPQRIDDKRETRSQGHDIMLAIDLSSSMLSEDYEKDGERMNRLQAIKPVIQAFIEQRSGDRIGIVLFSRRAYTLSPLTTDHDWLAQQLRRVKIGLIEDGTAIGDALGVALSRLREGEKTAGAGRPASAFIVLLTDGANNFGSLAPIQAAALAKARGVPIYTIGAGKDGIVPFPVFDEQGHKIGYRRILADLDENSLRDIANLTGGHFYRAADTGTIRSAFHEIDQGEKIEFAARSYLLTTELFPWLSRARPRASRPLRLVGAPARPEPAARAHFAPAFGSGARPSARAGPARPAPPRRG
jgi:Ca-activated chloride channel family protein